MLVRIDLCTDDLTTVWPDMSALENLEDGLFNEL